MDIVKRSQEWILRGVDGEDIGRGAEDEGYIVLRGGGGSSRSSETNS